MMSLPLNTILQGDAATRLRDLPAHSIDMVVTSPPYLGLRDYFEQEQIGSEASVEGWISSLRVVMREVARVLTPTGTLWLNLGDSYAAHARNGAPKKSRLLAPERLALALLEDGWIVRNHIAWVKPNPTPSSVADRLTCAWEPIYLLSRSGSYYFDLDAIRVPHTSKRSPRRTTSDRSGKAAWAGPLAGDQSGLDRLHALGLPGHPLGKNPGDAWIIPTSHYRSAHHATFPEALLERPIRAGCPERVCMACGRAWRREAVERRFGHLAVLGALRPCCGCQGDWRPGVVLDPFMGSGTTAVVAERLSRDWIGIELSQEFIRVATTRIDAARAGSRPAIRSPDAGSGRTAA